jgi:hypothetical protein
VTLDPETVAVMFTGVPGTVGVGLEQVCVATRGSVSAGHAAPPFDGCVMTVRAHVSVRDCWPPVHVLHAEADWNDHALTTQSTRVTVMVSLSVAVPPGPTATSVNVVVAVTFRCIEPESATASPLIVAEVALVVCQVSVAASATAPDGLLVAFSCAVGMAIGVTVPVRVTLPPGPVATSVYVVAALMV